MLPDEKIDYDETIVVSVHYRGKTYSRDCRFTDALLRLEGYLEPHLKEAASLAERLMHKALVAEGKINR